MPELPILAVVVPCYNEQDCIPSTTNRLLEVLMELSNDNVISTDSFIFYVDDGSIDNTWNVIQEYSQKNPNKVRGVKFSKNFGNQKAILAGLIETGKYNPDCLITIDADLQQPLGVAREMYDFLEAHQEYDAVAAYQEERKEGRILPGRFE